MPKVTTENPVIELTDPWNMQNTIREFISEYAS